MFVKVHQRRRKKCVTLSRRHRIATQSVVRVFVPVCAFAINQDWSAFDGLVYTSANIFPKGTLISFIGPGAGYLMPRAPQYLPKISEYDIPRVHGLFDAIRSADPCPRSGVVL
jgi:hypothetical protein